MVEFMVKSTPLTVTVVYDRGPGCIRGSDHIYSSGWVMIEDFVMGDVIAYFGLCKFLKK